MMQRYRILERIFESLLGTKYCFKQIIGILIEKKYQAVG